MLAGREDFFANFKLEMLPQYIIRVKYAIQCDFLAANLLKQITEKLAVWLYLSHTEE